MLIIYIPQDFEAAGGGKTPGSLKFALEFQKSVSAEHQSSVGYTENYYTRLQTDVT